MNVSIWYNFGDKTVYCGIKDTDHPLDTNELKLKHVLYLFDEMIKDNKQKEVNKKKKIIKKAGEMYHA